MEKLVLKRIAYSDPINMIKVNILYKFYIVWAIRNKGDFLYKGSYDWGEVCSLPKFSLICQFDLLLHLSKLAIRNIGMGGVFCTKEVKTVVW